MKSMAFCTATALVCGLALVLAPACTVSSGNGGEGGVGDTGGTTSSASGGSGGVEGELGGGGTVESGGSMDTGGTAGTGNEETGGTAGTNGGQCTTAMPDACATCLNDTSKGYSKEDQTGAWDVCQGAYPCCEEAARYVTCLRLASDDPDVIGSGYDGDAELYCSDTMMAGLDETQPSEEFVALSSDALAGSSADSCNVDCVFTQ